MVLDQWTKSCLPFSLVSLAVYKQSIRAQKMAHGPTWARGRIWGRWNAILRLEFSQAGVVKGLKAVPKEEGKENWAENSLCFSSTGLRILCALIQVNWVRIPCAFPGELGEISLCFSRSRCAGEGKERQSCLAERSEKGRECPKWDKIPAFWDKSPAVSDQAFLPCSGEHKQDLWSQRQQNPGGCRGNSGAVFYGAALCRECKGRGN